MSFDIDPAIIKRWVNMNKLYIPDAKWKQCELVDVNCEKPMSFQQVLIYLKEDKANLAFINTPLFYKWTNDYLYYLERDSNWIPTGMDLSGSFEQYSFYKAKYVKG